MTLSPGDYLHVVYSLLLGSLRVAGFKSQTYQAFAHLYVGGLFVASPWGLGDRWFYLVLALGLSTVELACFLWFKFVAAPKAMDRPL